MVIIIIVVVVVLVVVMIIFKIIILIPLHYSNSPQSRIIYDGLQADCTTDFLGDTPPPPPPGRATLIGLISAVSRCKSKSMPTVRLITTKILAILQSSAFL